MKPPVSILVTVYNRAQYLSEALESILRSTFQDFELIVVDDHSTDNSLSIARDIAQTDNRVRVILNPKNLGQFPNRQQAASLATGKYIKYVDSDDIIYPHSLDIMVDAIEQNPDAALALSHSDAEGEEPYPWKLSSLNAFRKQFLGRGCLSCGPSGAIINREAFFQIGGYDYRWGVVADIDLWFRLAAQWPGLVWWRRHEGQEFTHGDADLVYLQRGFQLAKEALSSPDCPLPEVDRDRALRRAEQHFARKLWSLALRQRRPGAALKMYRESGLTITDLGRGLKAYQ
jgi:glycosyltransferase involved in cell wall biosynthesis